MKKYILISLVLFSTLLSSCWQEAVQVTGITLDSKSITLVVGETFPLGAVISPANADNKIVIWTSDDASVARVADGVVTAVAPGSTTIRVKADDGGLSDSCDVKVVSEIVPVTGVSLSVENNPLVLQKGDKAALVAVVAPEDASDQSLRWTSSDDTVVSVDGFGQVTALATGEADIVVSTVDGGFSAGCKVIVEQHASGITLSESEITLKELESKLLIATFDPEDAVDALVWESSDPETAIVEYGVVRGLRANPVSVTITARTEDSRHFATCRVTVVCDVKGVTLKDHKLVMKVGEEYELVHTVYPPRATNKTVVWASDAPDVVAVAEGKLTAVRRGVAKISVTTEEGAFSDVCEVEVVNSISGMSLSPDSLSLIEEESSQLNVVFNPEGISDEPVQWTSSDVKVATVSDSGDVKAVGAGEAVICATTGSGLLAYCRVSVRKMVNSMRLDPETMVLYLARFKANENQQRVFKPIIDPEGSNVKLIWTSSDESVATVNSNGEVTPVSPGKAVITASTPNENVANRVSTSGSVTVIQEVTAISVSPESFEMWEGDTRKVDISFSPGNADTNYRVEFDGASTATLSFDKAAGTVKAETPGTATMYITPYFGYPQSLNKACSIKVLAHVHELKTEETSEIKVPVNTTMSLKDKVVYVPADAADKDLEWSSDNTTVATVDASGVVSGLKNGSATITATAKDKYRNASVSFKVIICETEVKAINLQPVVVEEGGSVQVVYSVEPADVLDPSLLWESANPFVATVDQNGVVTGIKGGTTVIKATSKATPSISATCGVTVNSKAVHVTSITLNRSTLSMSIGDSSTLVAQVLPDNADNRNIEWTVEQSGNVVSLSPSISSCSVNALAEGTATVKATSLDNGLSSSCTVTVTKPVVHVSSVTLDESSITLAFGTSHALTATVLPSNASDKTVTWTSDDESVAVVDGGTVTALNKEGTTTVHATSVDNNNIVASCTVKVVPKLVHVTGLYLRTEDGASSMTMSVGQVRRVVAFITPSDATDQTVSWSVQQGGVIFIDKDGYVTANKAGVSRVVAESNDGGYNASMQVTVIDNKPASIELSRTTLILKVGESFDLTAKVIGQNPDLAPTNGDVYWKSESTSIATAAGGHIHALQEGSTTITVKSEANDNVTATCQLTVIGGTPNGGVEGIEYDDWNF